MTKQKHRQSSFKDFLNDLEKKSIVSAKPVETIEERKYFLIVCEGERTEPEYFNYFKNILPRNLLDTIEITGEGDNTINIVRKAISLREERKKNILKPDYDEVWAVYDKDDFVPKRFNQAVALAKANKISSAHSNQSFELWYVLHFQYLHTGLHRSDYIKILTRELGFKYSKKDKKVVEHLFKNCNVKQAIKWAEKLLTLHVDSTPSQACPSTNVHKLVELLLTYCNHEY